MHKRKLMGLLLALMIPVGHAADQAQLKRGAHVVLEVCNGCHSLKYINYGDFMKVGFTKAEVDAMRGDKPMGEPLHSQMDASTELGMFGIVPPDLSLMAKAREGGSKYIYELVTGFYTDSKGQTANHAFPGVKMPDIFNISQADAAGKKEIEGKVRDAAAFLDWASDPYAEERTTLGKYVIGYFVLLTFLLFLLKKKIWKRLK